MSSGTIVRLDSKGRVTLPLEVRRRLGLREGSQLRILVDEEKGKIIIEKAESTAERYYGVFRPRRHVDDVEEEIEEAVYRAWLGDT
ncbi:MAG TPA: AbrB/MazE/SpoVT family DNA-binding domain-containing protein [Pyrodictium delaneyi]|uniref:AbrB/MazE/SpoVT family DNA-binding domain-containing protein n=1 Tax=Pyrodictium delaneyi TaxID=1273541 RepID=A0A832ZTJ7_9CREN|nr:AbrB/MazE/SpoVT family DNA-binding domain-containing protein [Pyrodictium delaneyi]